MFYLIWLCAGCQYTAPVNLGLYDSLKACETAKEQVVILRGAGYVRKSMACVAKETLVK